MMDARAFIDTNVLVYLSDDNSPFYQSVYSVFADVKKKYELWISRQVLREFAVVVSRPGFAEQPADSINLISALHKWKNFFYIADETEEVTRNLINLVSKYDVKGKRIHDANIVATMLVYDIPNLLTMNTGDFRNFSEIKLIADI